MTKPVYTFLAAYHPDHLILGKGPSLVRIMDATGDLTYEDIDAYETKALRMVREKFGTPGFMMILNNHVANNGYEATMAKITHTMEGPIQ